MEIKSNNEIKLAYTFCLPSKFCTSVSVTAAAFCTMQYAANKTNK